MTCRACNSPRTLTRRRLCEPCEAWLLRGWVLGPPVTREVALTECWLDEQARWWPGMPAMGETVKGMGWREFGTVVLLTALVFGFLLFA